MEDHSFKIYIKALTNAIVFGLIVWIIDSIIDWQFFYDGAFVELLITQVPAHEIYVRSVFFIALIIYGLYNAKNQIKLKRTNENIIKKNLELDALNQQLSANEQQLRANEQQLRANEQQLKASIQQLQASENELNTKAHDLEERVKELNGLYAIGESIWQNKNIDQILKDATNQIPPSWHYPDLTSGRITFDGKAYVSKYFAESDWVQSTPIYVDQKIVGKIEVFYHKEMPELDEGPFMREERQLIDAIAINLGRAIEKIQYQTQLEYERSQLKQQQKQFKAIFNGIDDIMYVSDPDTYEIVHANDIALKTYGEDIIGRKCYEAFHNKTEVCSFCTNQHILGDNFGKTFLWETKNESNNKWFRCADKAIIWPDGRKLRFELASDITEHVKLNEDLVAINQQLAINENQLKNSLTKLEQTQTDLIQNEKRYKQAEQLANVGSWEYNVETGYFWGSDKAKGIFGSLQEYNEFTVEQVNNRIPEKEKVMRELRALIENDKPYDIEYEVIQENSGRSRLIRSIGHLERNANGQPIRVFGAVLDITDQRKAEEKIKESQERFELVVKASNDGIWDWNILTNEVYYSPGWSKILKLEEVEQNFNAWESRIHPEDKESVVASVLDHVAGKNQLWEKEHRLRLPDGSYKWVLGRGRVVARDSNNKPLRMLGSMSDIQQRKEHEIQIIEAKKAAEDNETRFKALHNASFGGITIHDKGLILDCNKGLSDITGYTHDELIGMDGLLLIAEESRALVMSNILAKYEKPYEAIGLRKNGEKYPLRLEARMIPFKGKEARVVEFRDISEQKKIEDQLVKAKKKAEENDKLKSAFLANMSHEIRTPMNGILGFTSLLEDPDTTDEELSKYVEIIKRSGFRMLDTVNDIIDISKIDSGQMEVNIDKIDISKEINALYDFFKPEAAKKDIVLKLKNNLPNTNTYIIDSDLSKVNSIITNLIKNAIKYTDSGNIEILIESNSNDIICSISDTGVGIPKTKLEGIFKRFEQVDTKDTRASDGSGLGLAITKSYIEMLNGKIKVISEENKGSCFTFTLPKHNSIK